MYLVTKITLEQARIKYAGSQDIFNPGQGTTCWTDLSVAKAHQDEIKHLPEAKGTASVIER
jgi:hypothetical protein